MEICEGIETGREYYWRRTDGWEWFDGKQHWWEVFVVFDGLNGGGGVWITERWRWNGSQQTIRQQSRSLSFEETQDLLREVVGHLEVASHA